MDIRSSLERVAANFPEPPMVTGDADVGFEAIWHGKDISAGVRSYGNQVVVFIADAEAEVMSVSAATALLRGIFEDKYVAVAGFKNEALVRCYIAPADDIGAGLNSPTHVYLGALATPIDDLRVRSWSGHLDAGGVSAPDSAI